MVDFGTLEKLSHRYEHLYMCDGILRLAYAPVTRTYMFASVHRLIGIRCVS